MCGQAQGHKRTQRMATERDDQLRAAAVAALGPEDFDRLVVSVPATRQLGRLRYWQERLLARIPGGTVGLEEFMAAFDGAPLRQPPAPAPAQTEGPTGQPDWMKNAPAWVQEGREMNEAEWLAVTHIPSMVGFLGRRDYDHRRHVLFGCACCRQARDLLQHEAAWKLVELSEAFVDGDICEEDLQAGADPALFPDLRLHCGGLGGPGQLSARAIYAIGGVRHLASDKFRRTLGSYYVAQETSRLARMDFIPTPQRPMHPKGRDVPLDQEQLREKVKLLRDIFGNPFRPTAFSPSWRTDTAITLARQMYELGDFSAMPILADALEDAGCDSAEVLGHCRGPGPHVRGCHVVDLILGK
jgi:hypothetical protein